MTFWAKCLAKCRSLRWASVRALPGDNCVCLCARRALLCSLSSISSRAASSRSNSAFESARRRECVCARARLMPESVLCAAGQQQSFAAQCAGAAAAAARATLQRASYLLLLLPLLLFAPRASAHLPALSGGGGSGKDKPRQACEQDQARPGSGTIWPQRLRADWHAPLLASVRSPIGTQLVCSARQHEHLLAASAGRRASWQADGARGQ